MTWHLVCEVPVIFLKKLSAFHWAVKSKGKFPNKLPCWCGLKGVCTVAGVSQVVKIRFGTSFPWCCSDIGDLPSVNAGVNTSLFSPWEVTFKTKCSVGVNQEAVRFWCLSRVAVTCFHPALQQSSAHLWSPAPISSSPCYNEQPDHTSSFQSPQSWVWTREVWSVRLWGRLRYTGLVLQTADAETRGSRRRWSSHTKASEALTAENKPCWRATCRFWCDCPIWWWCYRPPLPDRRSLPFSRQTSLRTRERAKRDIMWTVIKLYLISTWNTFIKELRDPGAAWVFGLN